jgi:uncharacterized protein
MITRTLEKNIRSCLNRGKIIIIYWPRQVGKTTLAKKLMEGHTRPVYITCDDPTVVQALTNKSAIELYQYIWTDGLVVIDEAQRVPNIWLSLKLLIDQYPNLQIIATGSSSFELSQKVSEPLTGRKYEFMLYPLSIEELQSQYSNPEITWQLNTRIIKGMYPEIALHDHNTDLKTLASSYLFKDILEHQQLKNPGLLKSLLQALALQVWSEVSYQELSQLLWVDKNTIQRYIELLEKSFIVFTLPSLSRNQRNELKRAKKIYFYDTGLRNAVINNLNEPALRDDMGKLRENYSIMEIIKSYHNHDQTPNFYFWRTTQQQEIDLIVEQWWVLYAYECKRWNKKSSLPTSFAQAYPNHQYNIISPNNLIQHTTTR